MKFKVIIVILVLFHTTLAHSKIKFNNVELKQEDIFILKTILLDTCEEHIKTVEEKALILQVFARAATWMEKNFNSKNVVNITSGMIKKINKKDITYKDLVYFSVETLQNIKDGKIKEVSTKEELSELVSRGRCIRHMYEEKERVFNVPEKVYLFGKEEPPIMATEYKTITYSFIYDEKCGRKR